MASFQSSRPTVSDILVNIGPGNGLSPVRYHAIAWPDADLLSFEL